jgi:transposase
VSRVRSVQRHGEGSAGDAAEGSPGLWADGGAVVAETSSDLWGGAVPTQVVHPGLGGGPAAGTDHRAAAAAGGEGDRIGQPGRLRSRRRVRRVVADRAQGAGGRGHEWLPELPPTPRLGIDETRFRSVRWILDGITWKRSDPWLTSFVDCSRDGPGSLLGLAPGRTGACVREWLGEQSEAFRKMIKIVVIDPSAPYASGIRAALPDAKIAVDKWHLVALANQMVTEVRQRLTRDLLGRRGTVADPVWVNRRLLLTAAEHLSPRQWKRLGAMLDNCDPTWEIGAAWGVKERLRMLLAEHEPSKIRWRLADFYDAAIDARLPEATRLAETVQRWWPAILVALTADVSNARTEGFNRIIKQTKRVGCGYRNMINYQRRILSHIAVTRPQKSAA